MTGEAQAVNHDRRSMTGESRPALRIRDVPEENMTGYVYGKKNKDGRKGPESHGSGLYFIYAVRYD